MTLLDPPAVPSSTIAEPSWEVAKLFPRQGHWSKGDYLSLNTNRLVELSKGNIEVLPMATDLHQAIVAFVFESLLLFVRQNKLGTVRFAPLPIMIDEETFREPDVLFIKAENDPRRRNDFWEFADLVVEVMSLDRKRDLEVKRADYARIGVPEYWIIDSMLKEITVLSLRGEAYEPAGVYHHGDQAVSVLQPAFNLDVTSVLSAK